MGSDSLGKLHRWHFFKQIIKRVRFGIVVRHTQRYQIKHLPAIRIMRRKKTPFQLMLKPYQKISSTELRALKNKF
jgi:nicotinic acid mononucleotide adenylyltransferase